MKYLYIIGFWVPFPDSEYGGGLNVIAKSDEDCLEMLKLEYENKDSWVRGNLRELKEAVKDAKKFKLAEEHNHEIERIVMEFTT